MHNASVSTAVIVNPASLYRRRAPTRMSFHIKGLDVRMQAEVRRARRNHSIRNATGGCFRSMRHAGMSLGSVETPTSIRMADVGETGSPGPDPYSYP
jgi:hypothetical protein